MLAFNGYERLSSHSTMVVGLQRPDTTIRAGPALPEGEFQEVAIFYLLRCAKYLSGWFPRICVYACVESS